MAFWAACCGKGGADIVLSIQNEEVVPGGTAYVGFYAQSNTGFAISGFNLPTDINDDQMSTLPAGFTLNAMPIQNAIYTNTFFDTTSGSLVPAMVDGIVTGNGVDEPLTATPRKLFDLVINVATNVPVGTQVPITLLIPGNGLNTLFAVSGPNNPPVFAPTINTGVTGYIAVVPEPSSFAMLSLVGVMGGCVVAWRRRSSRS
jgi:hypothetical protein